MRLIKNILIYSIPIFIIAAIVWGIYAFSSGKSILGTSTSQTFREKEQIYLNGRQQQQTPISIPATKLPEFTLDLSEEKLKTLAGVAKEKLADVVQATLTYEAYAQEKIPTEVHVDQIQKKLTVNPKDIPNFKPGLYKLSLKLRTLEGEVNIEQDFTWGVLAVNTHKSIYKPGELAKIGIGVLDNEGNTQCKENLDPVKGLSMTVTNPQGGQTNFSIADNTIFDSGKCGPITVTNEADFQAKFTTSVAGTYQITVRAMVRGQFREITDYFKVESDVPFDVERTSFPTRIYPKSIYPVTFTVTARDNYSGKIEDVVPAFFKIKNISDEGRLERDGDFTRIIWDTSLTAGVPKTFTYFITFPQVSPEFYLLGPIKIGNFEEARQWQIASDVLNSTSGLVSYEDNGGPNTFSRVWTGTTWIPALGSAGSTMDTTPTDSRWFREVSSPKTGEKIVALIDNVTGGDRLFVFTWNGSSWSEDKNYGLNSPTNSDFTRPFDVAYEEESGDALFVFSDYVNAQLKYIKRVNGTWDTASSSAGTNFGTTTKRWVELEAKFNSDDILIGFLNDAEQVGAMIWNGATNTFENEFDNTASTATATSDEQAFDVAWETSSGTPMVFWGTTGNLITMREFNGTSWESESNIITGLTNDTDWLFASADPVSSSNNIAIAIQDSTSCVVRFGMWTGASATMNATTPACPSVTTNNLVDTAFENTGSRAMFVYVPDEGTEDDNLAWLTWSGGTFSSATTITQNIAVIEAVQLTSDLNTKTMMLLFHDNSTTCDLYTMQWDGTEDTWTTLALVYDNLCAGAGGDDSTLPYGFGFDRNLETVAAYRWYENNATSLGAPGVGDLVPIAATSSASTLTTENQQFRMRLLLYYPDSLLTSANRQYKLQFVDPGSGTCDSPSGGTPSDWTDVGTAGSTEISFHDNPASTMTDGANIATNSAEPSYQGLVVQYQDYEESNNFTNSRTNIVGNQTSIWDFSLVDNTTFDRTAQVFCFRVARSNDLVLQIGVYPQIRTASIPDVLIRGGTRIQSGTRLQ